MKTIAYYLPQFHEISENNEWWGKGFTEWTNTKKAIPLYKGHYQPKIPLEGYYSLENKSTLLRQAELAKKYNIYGMAFYHYWFEGKMLLQKPVENLLQWTDVPMNFMFCWANHDWIRSWNGTRNLLMKQTYGNRDDWTAHFMYLLPFFKDNRYIKIKNKPAFIFYAASHIPNLDKLIQTWNNLAKENGFEGIYFIETAMCINPVYGSELTDAVTLRQPNIANRRLAKLFGFSQNYPKLQKYIPFCYPGMMNYKMVMHDLIRATKSFKSNKDIIYGFFVGWDNTCRHGRRGSIMRGQNPVVFKKYLKQLIQLANKNSVDYVFINAWNEWAEGMYLEPDTKDGFAYLEAVKDVLSK